MIIKEGMCFLGRTLELISKDVFLAVTLDVGPRIITLKKMDEENIFFNDINDEILRDCSKVYGENKIWHLYGGHRIWLSPESEETYYPDNTPIEYELIENGAIFTPPSWKERDISINLRIEFLSSNEIMVTMKAKNSGKNIQKFALWSLSVCKSGGKLEIPLSTKNTGFLQNRNLVFWSYSDINDSRLSVDNERIIITSSTFANTPFKIGTYNENVYCKYHYRDTVFIKELMSPPGAYPDWNCNIESYTNNLIHEIETLSPLKSVRENQEIIHKEKWTII